MCGIDAIDAAVAGSASKLPKAPKTAARRIPESWAEARRRTCRSEVVPQVLQLTTRR